MNRAFILSKFVRQLAKRTTQRYLTVSAGQVQPKVILVTLLYYFIFYFI